MTSLFQSEVLKSLAIYLDIMSKKNLKISSGEVIGLNQLCFI